MLLAVGGPIGPISALFYVRSSVAKLGMIAGFALTFSHLELRQEVQRSWLPWLRKL